MLFFCSIRPLFQMNSRKSAHQNTTSRRSRHEPITLLSPLSCVLEHVPGRERDQRPCEYTKAISKLQHKLVIGHNLNFH